MPASSPFFFIIRRDVSGALASGTLCMISSSRAVSSTLGIKTVSYALDAVGSGAPGEHPPGDSAGSTAMALKWGFFFYKLRNASNKVYRFLHRLPDNLIQTAGVVPYFPGCGFHTGQQGYPAGKLPGLENSFCPAKQGPSAFSDSAPIHALLFWREGEALRRVPVAGFSPPGSLFQDMTIQQR